MKPKFRDYLTILMALVAIFLSGYGLGHLIGEKKGRKLAPSTIPLIQNSEDSTRPWEKTHPRPPPTNPLAQRRTGSSC